LHGQVITIILYRNLAIEFELLTGDLIDKT